MSVSSRLNNASSCFSRSRLEGKSYFGARPSLSRAFFYTRLADVPGPAPTSTFVVEFGVSQSFADHVIGFAPMSALSVTRMRMVPTASFESMRAYCDPASRSTCC
jgi:hypothetical protein